MKRLVMVLVVLFATTALFAGGAGKNCDIKHSAKTVSLTGTYTADAEKAVFRLANSDKTYVVCHKSKADLAKLSEGGKATLAIKGKLMSCDESEGEELIIESAKKI